MTLSLDPAREFGIDRDGVGVPDEMGVDDIRIIIDQALGIDLHLLRLMDVFQHTPVNITRGLFHVVEHVVNAVHGGLERLGGITECLLAHSLAREIEQGEKSQDEQEGQG